MSTKIAQEILAVLADCTVTDKALFLPPDQLDRKTYLKVNEVLEGLGGKWNKKQKAHIFEWSPSDALAKILEEGAYCDEKKEHDAFFTPLAVVEKMHEADDLCGKRILEPSAGGGAIARYVLHKQGASAMATTSNNRLVCVEVQKKLADKLEQDGFVVKNADFLTLTPVDLGYFDRISMNPPFSKQQDIDHVRHAYSFLAPGGLLVAIMSAGVKFRMNKKAVEFRGLVDGCGSIEDLPPHSFRESGTDVETVIVVLNK